MNGLVLLGPASLSASLVVTSALLVVTRSYYRSHHSLKQKPVEWDQGVDRVSSGFEERLYARMPRLQHTGSWCSGG